MSQSVRPIVVTGGAGFVGRHLLDRPRAGAQASALLAISWYGASKVAGEAYFRAFRREFGLHTVILRLANVYGPRDIGRVIPLWLEQASAGREIQVYGGKQVVDFVWVG